MRNMLKEWFIPHRENDFKPHFFRTAGLLFLTGTILVIFIISVLGFRAVSSGNYAAIIASVLVELTNDDRTLEGKRTLLVSETLTLAAQMKAQDMAAKGYFAHTSPEGRSPWYWFGLAGYRFSYAGENLAVNFSDSIDVERAWMNSPGHRANIVNGSYTEIGIAMAHGTYNGRRTTFVVQLFGRPAIAVAAGTTTAAAPVLKATSDSGAAAGQNKALQSAPAALVPSETNADVLASQSFGSEEAFDIIVEDETFIAVRQNGQLEPTDAGSLNRDDAAMRASFFARLFSAPSTFLQYTYALVVALVILALIIDVVVEIRRQHPLHVLYAALLLALIFALLYIARVYIMFPGVSVL